jgi:peptidoglycan-associated lipoprotein
LINDTRKAESYYSRAVKQKSLDPKARLLYADMLKINGKTALAKAEYEEYLKVEPGDATAQLAYQSCDSILVWTKNPTRYQIANVKDFNTKFNDYSPYFASKDYKELYISSSRDGAAGNKIHGGTGQSFSDIFYTRLDNKQKWAVPAPVDKVINTEFDDGAPWVSEDGATMYFTRCRFDKQMALGCQVMMAKRTGAKWADPVVVPIAKDSMIVAHPSLTEDQLTIYFASDMLGSIGWKGYLDGKKRESRRAVWSANQPR